MAAPLQFLSPQTAQMLMLTQQVRAYERISTIEQQALQGQQLLTLIRHAHQYSVFWRARLAKAGWDGTRATVASAHETLSRLPPLTRTDLQGQFEALRAHWPQLKAQDIATSITSGSTGEPVRVEKALSLYGPLYAAVSWTEALWHQRNPTHKIAVLAPSLQDGASDTWGEMYNGLGLRGPSVVRNLTLHSMASHLDWLVAEQPQYLKTSPHAAGELARLALASGIALPIQQIISQSERVTPAQRALCEEAFGAKIIDRYSCEETGWIALQCPSNEHLHVLNATTLLEIVDTAGKPCPVGTPGRVLLTSLHSYAMPILRYELGDVAEWGPPCGCGMTLPVLGRMWGRSRHQLKLPSGTLPMPFLGDELGAISAIHAFRILQYAGSDIELQLELVQPLTPTEIHTVRSIFDSNGLGTVPLHITVVKHIAWPQGRKREEFEAVDHPWPQGVRLHD